MLGAAAVAATAIIISIAILSSVWASNDLLDPMENMMKNNDGNGMISGNMMGQAPRDAIIEFNSTAEVPAGSEAQVRLLVLDKQTMMPKTPGAISSQLLHQYHHEPKRPQGSTW